MSDMAIALLYGAVFPNDSLQSYRVKKTKDVTNYKNINFWNTKAFPWTASLSNAVEAPDMSSLLYPTFPYMSSVL